MESFVNQRDVYIHILTDEKVVDDLGRRRCSEKSIFFLSKELEIKMDSINSRFFNHTDHLPIGGMVLVSFSAHSETYQSCAVTQLL